MHEPIPAILQGLGIDRSGDLFFICVDVVIVYLVQKRDLGEARSDVDPGHIFLASELSFGFFVHSSSGGLLLMFGPNFLVQSICRILLQLCLCAAPLWLPSLVAPGQIGRP